MNFSVQYAVTFCMVRGRWVSVRNEVVSVLFLNIFFQFFKIFFSDSNIGHHSLQIRGSVIQVNGGTFPRSLTIEHLVILLVPLVLVKA